MNGGASLRGNDWCDKHVIYDDTGDNISDKNSLFNELTSIYWAWKHLEEIGNPDFIGFNHYRKFFKREQIEDFADYDVMLARPVRLGYYGRPVNALQNYMLCHNESDLAELFSALRKKIQLHELVQWCCEMSLYAPLNMWVMRKDIFSAYCEDMFGVMREISGSIDLSGRDNYQKRAYAFLSERFTSIWFYTRRNSLKVKFVEVEEHPEWKNNMLNERGTYS